MLLIKYNPSSVSHLESQHILKGAQVQTNVTAVKEEEEKKIQRKAKKKKKKTQGRGGLRKKRFVDRILSWKIF